MPNMSTKKVLLFDDDDQILEVCTIILEYSGYTVVSSAVVTNIIAQVKAIQPDIILMDNWIPDIGGIQATQLLKKHPDTQHIPVIYITANSNIESLAEEAGADNYLAKPFNMEELEQTVAECILNNHKS